MVSTPKRILQSLQLNTSRTLSALKYTKKRLQNVPVKMNEKSLPTYFPIMYMNKNFLREDLIQVNQSTEQNSFSNQSEILFESKGNYPLQLSVDFVSVSNFLFYEYISESIALQRKLGLGDKEINEIENIFFGTNFYLLLFTLIISFLHMFIDYLAFQSDISFWKNVSSMIGISKNKELINFVCQIIILFYLENSRASMLLLIPQLIGILIQLWKLWKIFDFSDAEIPGSDKIKSQELSEADVRELHTTKEVDRTFTYYTLVVLSPLVVGYIMNNLIYEKYSSFYSWFVESLAGSVYVFGFVTMIPQLVINYKLKSVKYISFHTLFYKFINTFIDDLFAFIIVMPTMHRLACFRDDVVFIIYMYQRYIYSVDKSRRHEKVD